MNDGYPSAPHNAGKVSLANDYYVCRDNHLFSLPFAGLDNYPQCLELAYAFQGVIAL